MENRKIEAFIFDCDGVLVDSEPALAIIAAELLNQHGLPAVPADFIAFIGTGEDRYLGGVIEKYNGTYDPSLKDELYRHYIEKAPGRLTEVKGISDLIKKLKAKGYKIAVASSADRLKVDTNLKALNTRLSDYDAIITGSDIERKKPWPDIYLKAAAAIGVTPEHCVVVEDAVSGVEAGKAADMAVIGITTSLGEKDLFEAGADFVISSYDEFYSIIGLDRHQVPER